MARKAAVTRARRTPAKALPDLPYQWEPRPYQLPAWNYLMSGGKRAVLVWHRRAGKDDIGLHFTAVEMFRHPASYWYMFPTLKHARDVVWAGVDPHTKRRRLENMFPRELFPDWHEVNMTIKAKNGATLQLLGSDNYDTAVGASPRGIVFSEWPLADERAFGFLSPILAENGGWAIFAYTPRGTNHGLRFYETAKAEEDWFGQLLTVDDTNAISKPELEKERRIKISTFGEQDGQALFDQEFYCSFNADTVGSFYGSYMRTAEKQGRIGEFPYNPQKRVATSWDLGYDDSTAIWFWQEDGDYWRLIDYYQDREKHIGDYIKWLSDTPYIYYQHVFPHDADRNRLDPESYIQIADRLGLKHIEVQPRTLVMDRVNAARANFTKFRFNTKPVPHIGETPAEAEARMMKGLDALRQYEKQFDQIRREFTNKAKHTWARDGADAFGYGVQRVRKDSLSNLSNLSRSYIGANGGEYSPLGYGV